MRLLLVLIAVSLACIGAQFEPLANLTYWNRTLIFDDQWWRILTGNFTHTNFTHLGMNLAGLWVISYLFRPKSLSLMWVLLGVSLGVGVLNLMSNMSTYVGLSGALHGFFAYYALKEWLEGRSSSGWLVLGVIAKVTWEMTMGASQSTSELIGARVAVESHMFGTISGLVLAFTVRQLHSLVNQKGSQQ
ncbi:rhombosortase [Vibrio ostreicida]|uniref:rhombosortase n=1 Tax=Vibrio ostreicida TaxID=526588 RepID=UPI0009708F91|nr:rhombosortase [Vibrio ostreicida]